MRMPISPELTPELERQSGNPAVAMLSLESQLKLRSLYEYVDSCRRALNEIRRNLGLQASDPEGPANLRRASEILERFCLEADSWGFNALYEIAFGLQVLLLNCGSRRMRNSDFREALRRGLALLSALLEQCERDFCSRLATADMLDYFDRAGR